MWYSALPGASILHMLVPLPGVRPCANLLDKVSCEPLDGICLLLPLPAL